MPKMHGDGGGGGELGEHELNHGCTRGRVLEKDVLPPRMQSMEFISVVKHI